MNFKFLVTKFVFTEFQKVLTFCETFCPWLHRPLAAEVEAKGEKPSTSAKELWPSTAENKHTVCVGGSLMAP